METLAVVFGKRLKALRKQKGLTQEALGRLTKVDYKYLGSIERGERTPSFETIERIAKALRIEYGELFQTDNQLPAGLAVALKDGETFDRSKMQVFFRDLLHAVQKLNDRPSSRKQ